MGYMATNYWEIQDSNGVIHSGYEDEMTKAFDSMILSTTDLAETYDISEKEAVNLSKQWWCEYAGDLKLVEVHNIYR